MITKHVWKWFTEKMFFYFFLRASPKPDSSTVRRQDDARTLLRRTGTDSHTFGVL